MINQILANCACDRCGERFAVALEPALQPPVGWTLYEVAEDAIRGGRTLHAGQGPCGLLHEQYLCPARAAWHDMCKSNDDDFRRFEAACMSVAEGDDED